MIRRVRTVVLFLSIFLNVFALNAARLPAPLAPDETTSGALCSEENSDFTEYRYGEEIPYCERNVSSGLKNEIYRAYGVPAKCRSEYTIDHFYPLSLGGDNSRENLWPEHKAVKATRQNLELVLYKQLSKGEIKQAAALALIRKEKMNPSTGNIADGDYCDLNLIYKN